MPPVFSNTFPFLLFLFISSFATVLVFVFTGSSGVARPANVSRTMDTPSFLLNFLFFQLG